MVIMRQSRRFACTARPVRDRLTRGPPPAHHAAGRRKSNTTTQGKGSSLNIKVPGFDSIDELKGFAFGLGGKPRLWVLSPHESDSFRAKKGGEGGKGEGWVG
ncbi:hypothetical protein M407DRAFT_170083 [Tulasnella calospora MUT 4182]|uniref:Uncharacterized protein n=1 Tax=Tulasnella calospora MUT 4182 TaxID=1051891 RepID=A0A0C3M710_9AGAM|nr:hypothetical protein M407DRAFT_170083 [Tulasnella calospora MUT 4182]